ncbi:nitrogen permease regulator 2 [Calycina marina]|uniref:Nitrogen permease regulator 2 n=1 Tax=Calycina marina TaxID=1763456 RepID=A0A9P8CFT2_9HELO|nr:nitrogen permease regulator 2 [Calycina marina]
MMRIGMIEAIFFARFLPEQGTKVVHQSPPGCIVSEPGVDRPCMFDFETMSEYIIPKQAFCNRYVSISEPEGKWRILGHPVCIKSDRYERNEFIFNFCLVISMKVEKAPHETVVRRLASTFTELEIQNQYLSKEDLSNSSDRRSIAALLEIIKEDLNNYNECKIPVGVTEINMKLFPAYKQPPPVKLWHVPITKIRLEDVMDSTWDLTLNKIVAHIDGVKDVSRIAHDADVALHLTKTALQHLLYYECILMVDIFMFGNIYAPTPLITDFIANKDGLQKECADYVFINGPRLDNFYLVRMFTSLCTGRTLKEWLKLHMDDGLPVMDHVDVRRFIQFGIIKGLVYRIHKYAVSSQVLEQKGEVGVAEDDDDILQKYLDGCHHFDQIMVEQNMDDVKIMEYLRNNYPKGDVDIIYR